MALKEFLCAGVFFIPQNNSGPKGIDQRSPIGMEEQSIFNCASKSEKRSNVI
jgi:hypothetical protein